MENDLKLLEAVIPDSDFTDLSADDAVIGKWVREFERETDMQRCYGIFYQIINFADKKHLRGTVNPVGMFKQKYNADVLYAALTVKGFKPITEISSNIESKKTDKLITMVKLFGAEVFDIRLNDGINIERVIYHPDNELSIKALSECINKPLGHPTWVYGYPEVDELCFHQNIYDLGTKWKEKEKLENS